MHVLITETQFGDADEVAGLLHGAGCHVTRCHDRAGICRALGPGRRCPLDGRDPIDLMVDVREPLAELTAREYGAVRAVRARIPLAIVSVTDGPAMVPDGLAHWATAVNRAELLDTCRAAMRHDAGVR